MFPLNSLKFAEHHGWREVLKRLRIHTLGKLYDRRVVYLAVLQARTVAQQAQAVKVSELKSTDVHLMTRTMYLSPSEIRARFARGDRCFAVLDEGEAVSYMWVASTEHRLSEAHVSFVCGPGQAWLYNAVTIKSARGKGYYTRLFGHISTELAGDGIEELYGYAEETNAASLGGLKKAGFTTVACLKVTKSLKSRRFEARVFDDAMWAKLRKTMLCPDAADEVIEKIDSTGQA